MNGPDSIVSQLGWAPYVVLGGYLLTLLGLGLAGYRRGKADEEDYYLAGRGQGWLVSGLTIMATFFSSFALLGAPGMAYKEGVVFALFSLNVPVAGLCVYLLGARIWRIGRAKGYVTPADMVSDYYGSRVLLRLLVALAGFLFTAPYVMMQIRAGGLLSEKLFDGAHAFEIGATLLATITTVYIMIGGMRSVAWTDVLQGALLVSGMFVAGGAMIYALGGLGEFGQRICKLPASSLTVPGTTGYWQWPMIFTVCLLSSSGAMVQPAQWMRYYAARNPKTLRRAAVIFAVVLPACFIFGVMIVGVGGQVIYPLQYDDAGALADANELLGENKYDQILIVFLKEQLPELFGVLGVMVASLVIVAIMAASMSTADSSLHALSAVATRDVYDPFIRPSAGQRERVWIGRLVIVLATVFAVVIVVADEWRMRATGQQYEFMKHIAILGLVAISFSAQLLPLTIDILFLRKGTKAGAIAGLTVGLLAAFLFGGLFQPVLEALRPGPESALTGFNGLLDKLKSAAPVHASAWGLLFNVPIFVLVSLFTPRLPAGHRAEFGDLAAGKRGERQNG